MVAQRMEMVHAIRTILSIHYVPLLEPVLWFHILPTVLLLSPDPLYNVIYSNQASLKGGGCMFYYLWGRAYSLLPYIWYKSQILNPWFIYFYPPIPKNAELEMLKDFKKTLEEELKWIEERIKSLEEGKES